MLAAIFVIDSVWGNIVHSNADITEEEIFSQRRFARNRFPVSQLRQVLSDELSTDEPEITNESISRVSYCISSRPCARRNVITRSIRAIKHLGVIDSRSCLSTTLNTHVSRPPLRAINYFLITRVSMKPAAKVVTRCTICTSFKPELFLPHKLRS